MRQKTRIELPHGYDPRLLLWCFFIMSSVPSCCVCKHCPVHNYNDRDSTVVSYKDSVSVKDSTSVRDSTIQVPLPNESSQSILPLGQRSHLETSLAESNAYVDSLGLHHTLTNKEGEIDVHVPVTDHFHYEYQNHQKDSTHTQEHAQIVEAEKPLTWWQQFRLDAFWWLVGGIALLLLWTFRKSIFKIV